MTCGDCAIPLALGATPDGSSLSLHSSRGIVRRNLRDPVWGLLATYGNPAGNAGNVVLRRPFSGNYPVDKAALGSYYPGIGTERT
jgi:hypothetical protein